MAGQIRRMIDRIVEGRSRGDPTLASLTTTKLVLRGIRLDDYDLSSPDDPDVAGKLRGIAEEFGVPV